MLKKGSSLIFNTQKIECLVSMLFSAHLVFTNFLEGGVVRS